MKRPFGKKSKDSEENKSKKQVKEGTSLVDPDYNRKKLFKKGVNLMADEKLEEAVMYFQQALRIDPEMLKHY